VVGESLAEAAEEATQDTTEALPLVRSGRVQALPPRVGEFVIWPTPDGYEAFRVTDITHRSDHDL